MRFPAAGMGGLSRGVRAEMSFGYGRESQGYAAGPPGNVFMNRLNFEKMDKKKSESIDDVLYAVTEGRIVRRRKNPLPALLIGVAGAGLAIWSLTASSMSEHENLASILMLLGGGVALVGLIMAGIALASGSPVYEPTGERIRRGSIYYDTARKQELCAALEAGDADRTSRIPRGGSTSGVLLTLYATGSGSFAMAQVLEYVPHAFEPVTEVVLFSAEQGRAVAAML